MEQGRIFKQPFKKTITIRTVFYTALFVFMAFWLGMRIIFPILSNFHMEQFNSIWSIIALISISLLFFASVFASLILIICNNYVIVYNDRLVCQNRFISVLSQTFHFEKYKDHQIAIYVPWMHFGAAFNRIYFFKPYWESRYTGLLAISKEDCFELAEIFKSKGFDVKIYNERLLKKKR